MPSLTKRHTSRAEKKERTARTGKPSSGRRRRSDRRGPTRRGQPDRGGDRGILPLQHRISGSELDSEHIKLKRGHRVVLREQIADRTPIASRCCKQRYAVFGPGNRRGRGRPLMGIPTAENTVCARRSRSHIGRTRTTPCGTACLGAVFATEQSVQSGAQTANKQNLRNQRPRDEFLQTAVHADKTLSLTSIL